MAGCKVKTELMCSEAWGDGYYIELPPMFHGDQIHLEFTHPENGAIKGLFEIDEILHFHNSTKGYTQRLKLKPVS